jgi:hypothetical protein
MVSAPPDSESIWIFARRAVAAFSLRCCVRYKIAEALRAAVCVARFAFLAASVYVIDSGARGVAPLMRVYPTPEGFLIHRFFEPDERRREYLRLRGIINNVLLKVNLN